MMTWIAGMDMGTGTFYGDGMKMGMKSVDKVVM